MQQVKNIVKGPYEPQDNTVIWIDTSNPDTPIAKVHSNGEWKAISGVDNLPTVLNEIVDNIEKISNIPFLSIPEQSFGKKTMSKEEKEIFNKNTAFIKYGKTICANCNYAVDSKEKLYCCTYIEDETGFALDNNENIFIYGRFKYDHNTEEIDAFSGVVVYVELNEISYWCIDNF